MDLIIDKPASVSGYALHRLVEQMGGGLWADLGSTLRVRKKSEVVPVFEAEKLLVFDLTACVYRRTGGRVCYYPLGDWRSRKAWLEKEAEKNGFELVGVHIEAGKRLIEKSEGAKFTVDATNFVGLLRVTDPALFSTGLIKGIGRVGKAFGLGLLIVN